MDQRRARRGAAAAKWAGPWRLTRSASSRGFRRVDRGEGGRVDNHVRTPVGDGSGNRRPVADIKACRSNA